MATSDRFKQNVIATIAKRAGNRCSNPDCGAITSGPADAPTGSVNVGEAAHIYGASPGSARYDGAMPSSDRSAITNAIWLCRNCHKLVDDDPDRFPFGLLFEWQRNHEHCIAELVGKSGAEVRRRYEERHLEEFGRLSYIAQRIILEKGQFWEYRLTTETLRFEMTPVLRRWDALKRGLYMKPSERIGQRESMAWILNRLAEVQRIAHAFQELMNVEFARAWGAPGIAGSDIEIVSVCRLYTEMCESALAWEEAVRFIAMEKAFEEIQQLFVGIAGGLIEEAAKVPKFLAESIGDNPQPGEYNLSLNPTLPEGWEEDISAALKRAEDKIMSEIADGSTQWTN